MKLNRTGIREKRDNSATLEIIEDEIYSLTFSIPAMTPAEEKELSRQEYIDANRPYKEEAPAVTAHRRACRVNRKPSRIWAAKKHWPLLFGKVRRNGGCRRNTG